VSDFSENQFTNLVSCLEKEEWKRLPIPDNYKIEENDKLMNEYPKNYKKYLKIFKQLFDGKLEKFKSSEVFVELITKGNPFSKGKLMNA